MPNIRNVILIIAVKSHCVVLHSSVGATYCIIHTIARWLSTLLWCSKTATSPDTPMTVQHLGVRVQYVSRCDVVITRCELLYCSCVATCIFAQYCTALPGVITYVAGLGSTI